MPLTFFHCEYLSNNENNKTSHKKPLSNDIPVEDFPPKIEKNAIKNNI